MIQAASVWQPDPNLNNGDDAMQYESEPDSLESGFGGTLLVGGVPELAREQGRCGR